MSEAQSLDRIKRTIEAEAGSSSSGSRVVTSPALEKPAFGLVAREGSGDAVAGAILRAERSDIHVLVTYETECEAVEFAKMTGATIVDPGIARDEEELKQVLATRARDYGFPGLIYQASPSEPVDIERTVLELRESSAYVVEPTVVADSRETPDVVVGIPAFDEEVSIGSVVLRARQFAKEVIVVDDGSTDDTAEVAETAGATVVRNAENRGKGAAVRTLLSHVRGMDFEALVLMDGDGQHSPKDVPQVAEPVLEREADVAIGSRYMDGRRHDTPRYRRLGQRVLDVMTIGSSRKLVSDSQSGFRALSPRAVDTMQLRTDGFGVESEMINGAAENGLEIVETPIDVRYDVEGSTENPLRHGLAVMTFILQLVRDRHPLVFFGVPGLMLAAFGAALGIQAVYAYSTAGTFYGVRAMISGFLVIVGCLGLFAGFMLNQIANIMAMERGGRR